MTVTTKPLTPAEMLEIRNAVIARREAMWYPEPQRSELLKELDALAHEPSRHRVRSLAIVGEANSGKSTLIKQYAKLHPVVRGKEGMEIPSLNLRMTRIRRVEDLSTALVQALGAPDWQRGNHMDRLERFILLAKRVKLGLLFLDEFHDCADTTGRGKPFLRAIKDLVNEGIHVVPVGTEELAAVLSLDSQLSSRFNFSRGRLARIEDLGVIKAIIRQITQQAAGTVDTATAQYVLEQTKGVMGHLLDLVETTFITHGKVDVVTLKQTRRSMDVLDHVR